MAMIVELVEEQTRDEIARYHEEEVHTDPTTDQPVRMERDDQRDRDATQPVERRGIGQPVMRDSWTLMS